MLNKTVFPNDKLSFIYEELDKDILYIESDTKNIFSKTSVLIEIGEHRIGLV